MDRRFSRNLSNEGRGSINLQKKLAESKRVISRNEQVPDLSDLMNDLFFGASNTDKKAYNLTGNGHVLDDRDEEDFDSNTRSVSSRLTQEWLQEAKRIVASSPSRIDSPSRLAGSPRFATSQGRLSTSPLEKRDPFDRSARSPIPTPTNHPAISKRNFKDTASTTNNAPTTILDTPLLSPPKHLIESAHRRSISSTTCSRPESNVLSPPRNLVESAHRRSISSSTCSTDRILQKSNGLLKEGDLKSQELNKFLKEQRIKIEKILSGGINGKAKIVLSGPSNRDGKCGKQQQAAWLFHHVGLDATALLFANEVDLETLIMEKRLSMLVVGEDILLTNGEVGSGCTMVTDNYCEDAYDLLQTPIVKKLLLAGILLDTQNLNVSTKLSMARDAEAVQLLSVGSVPNYRNAIFDQLMQDQRDNDFLEVLHHSYGKPSGESNWDSGASIEKRISEKYPFSEGTAPRGKNQNNTKDESNQKVSPISGTHAASPMKMPVQAPAKTPAKAANASQGKNKNFFAKLFGFGSKQ
ncbi:Uncharacterized protein Adt_41248 [Abeliophyllum distichum]|uniref:Uncharacterized protein n=1 Tax=Abeliophyllum distichum TaxID=126358 RepID=A0ABD1PP46_9LAMI